MIGTAVSSGLFGLLPWMELKSWASWHIAQEHHFLEHEHSPAGSIASTEVVPKSVRSCLFLLQDQGSAQHFTAAPQHRAVSTLQLYMGSSGASLGGDLQYLQWPQECGRGEGTPVLPADLGSHSAAHPWPCHMPQGHKQGPTGTATCSTSGCPALPSLSPAWAVKVTGVPDFCSEGVCLLLSSAASYCAFSSLVKDLLGKCTSSNGDCLKFGRYYFTLKRERSAVIGEASRREAGENRHGKGHWWDRARKDS